MLLSLNWLREFTPYEGSVEALSARLTMLGLEVEEVKRPFGEIEHIVVGHVVEREKHPEADKLSVCKVDVGSGELLQIVCGAPNVAAGQNVPVALVGSTMPGGMAIKRAKLRGVESLGMICSARELGLSEDHAGIMVLDERFRPGVKLVEALKLDLEVLDIGVTPNRADCLSVLGLAREVALAFDLPLTMPKVELEESDAAYDATDALCEILIPDGGLCPVYRARILRDCKVGPSPDWMRYRLIACGVRPISNLVDVTNYVMFELGQPLHAFDRSKLATAESGKTLIVVEQAAEGQEFVTLDSAKRVLTGRDLLIKDADKPVALAGVMGGENTEVSESTTEMLLECAVFNPAAIRKTARRLGLSSESSFRFERGVDQAGSLFALRRAAALMQRLAGGRLTRGEAVAEPKPVERRVLPFRPARSTAILGLELGEDFARKTLTGLGCEVTPAGESWKVEVPPHRLDLEREIDLIEEVGRVYGLDRIPAELPRVGKTLAVTGADVSESAYDFALRVKRWARGLGLNEAINFSFVGERDLNLLGLPQEGRVRVANPLSEDQGVLRPILAPGLLISMRNNLAQGNAGLRLFEVAARFAADPSSETTVAETPYLGILLTGERHEGWPWPAGEADYLDLKGLVERLCSSLGLPAPACALAESGSTWLSPAVDVTVNGAAIGRMGQVIPEIAAEYHARKEVWLAEIDLAALRGLCDGRVARFTPLPTYPPIRRDVTLAAPASLKVQAVLDAILAKRHALLEDARLHDVFEPKDADERNLTFRLTYRHKDKTLSDKEVDKVNDGVRTMLEQELGARLI